MALLLNVVRDPVTKTRQILLSTVKERFFMFLCHVIIGCYVDDSGVLCLRIEIDLVILLVWSCVVVMR